MSSQDHVKQIWHGYFSREFIHYVDGFLHGWFARNYLCLNLLGKIQLHWIQEVK